MSNNIMDSHDWLLRDERGCPERLEQGEEAMTVLKEWYSKLTDMGYYIKDHDLYKVSEDKMSDDKAMVLIHSIENQSISVLPILSCW